MSEKELEAPEVDAAYAELSSRINALSLEIERKVEEINALTRSAEALKPGNYLPVMVEAIERVKARQGK